MWLSSASSGTAHRLHELAYVLRANDLFAMRKWFEKRLQLLPVEVSKGSAQYHNITNAQDSLHFVELDHGLDRLTTGQTV
jgi:hypothetical protein